MVGSRAKRVFTVEHDLTWYKKLRKEVDSLRNIEMALRESEDEYVMYILEQDVFFDVVVIDGRWRGKCAKAIEGKLNRDSEEGWMVILDNSDWYPGIVRFLSEKLNPIIIDFHGFGPVNGYTWTTSIFVSRNFNFKFKENRHSIAAIGQRGEDDIYESY